MPACCWGWGQGRSPRSSRRMGHPMGPRCLHSGTHPSRLRQRWGYGSCGLVGLGFLCAGCALTASNNLSFYLIMSAVVFSHSLLHHVQETHKHELSPAVGGSMDTVLTGPCHAYSKNGPAMLLWLFGVHQPVFGLQSKPQAGFVVAGLSHHATRLPRHWARRLPPALRGVPPASPRTVPGGSR